MIAPSNVMEVLAMLPVLTRDAIQADETAFLAEGMGEAVEDATGGSTGTPMTFKVDRSTQVSRESSLYWANRLADWQYGERVAMLWGSDRDARSGGEKLQR